MKAVHTILLTSLILLVTSQAHADKRGQQLLKEFDDTLQMAKSQFLQYDVLTEEPGKEPRKLQFSVTYEGQEKRRVEFLEPGDLRGMKILILNLTKMYIYLPAYKKVRRVASHVQDQGFMGTAFSYDEMSIVQYSPLYDATLVEETPTQFKLQSSRKPGKENEIRYPRLDFTIDKKLGHATKIEYFNDKGEIEKTELRPKYRCNKKLCTPDVMIMTDHAKGDLKSTLTVQKWKPYPPIPKNFFTVRALQRRR